MKKIGIIHSVAINGGDQLLLESLIQGLEKYCKVKVQFVTTNNFLSYPFITKGHVLLNSYFDANIEMPYKIEKLSKMPIIGKLIKKIFNSFINLQKTRREVNDQIKETDFIILMAGGFIHEYYDFYKNLAPIIFQFKKQGKPIFIVGQSIGPFENNPEEAIKFLT